MLGTTYIEILKLVGEALKDKSWALIGGAALPARGRARGTRDLDLLAAIPETEMSALIERLQESGFAHHPRADQHQLERVTLYRFWFPVSQAASAGVDIQLPHDAFLNQVVERATAVELLGVSLPVATTEDLVLLKLLSFRPIDRADIIDLVYLSDTFDHAYVAGQLQALGVNDRWSDVQQALSELVRDPVD